MDGAGREDRAREGVAEEAHRGLGPGPRTAHLPLVPIQQGRPRIWQSMCGKPERLLLACSVQICRRGTEWGMELCSGQRASLPFPDRSHPHTLTGHLVMSSGQMWAPLEAGSSQVLEAEVGGGKMWGLGIPSRAPGQHPSRPRPLASTPSRPCPPDSTPTGGTNYKTLIPVFSESSAVGT